MKVLPITRYRIINPGPRPPYYELADYLWGENANIDSDGNSDSPEDTNWTELSVSFRDDNGPYVNVDPVSSDPLVLEVSCFSSELAKKAAEYLAKITGGKLEIVSA
jgi:hypothetical protein